MIKISKKDLANLNPANRNKKSNILNTLYSSINSYDLMKIDDISFESFIISIKKNDNEKSIKDYFLIMYYLEKTELISKFSKEGNLGIEKRKLLFFCAINIEFKFCEKDEILLKEGDLADCFYINFNGSLIVTKIVEYSLNLNVEEYINILIVLMSNNMNECVNRMIKINNEKFGIKKSDLSNLKIILFIIKFKRIINSPEISFKRLSDLIKENQMESIKIEFNSYIEYTNKNLEKILETIVNFYCPSINLKNYEFVVKDEKKLLTIIEEKNIFQINKGKLFGDMALETKSYVRNATIRSLTESYLGKIPHEIYRDYILNEKQKIIAKEIDFLYSNFFFKVIHPSVFNKKLFYEFVSLEYSKGTVIINEKDELQYLYFIRDGEIQININLSILELNNLIYNLVNETKCYPDPERFLDSRIDTESKDSELNKKKVFKIYIFPSKEIVGTECIFFKIPSFYKAVINTTKAKVYSIDRKKITSTLNEYNGCQSAFESIVKNKFLLILRRLIEIRDISIKLMSNFSIHQNSLDNLHSRFPLITTNTYFIEPLLYKKIVSPYNSTKTKNEVSPINKSSKVLINSSLRLKVISRQLNTINSVDINKESINSDRKSNCSNKNRVLDKSLVDEVISCKIKENNHIKKDSVKILRKISNFNDYSEKFHSKSRNFDQNQLTNINSKSTNIDQINVIKNSQIIKNISKNLQCKNKNFNGSKLK